MKGPNQEALQNCPAVIAAGVLFRDVEANLKL